MSGFTISGANKWLEFGGNVKAPQINSYTDGKLSIGGIAESPPSSVTSFADTLREAIGSVNEIQKSADKMAQELATGRTDNIAEVMIATEKADIALKLMVQVRNKIIDAYQEVMKMQV